MIRAGEDGHIVWKRMSLAALMLWGCQPGTLDADADIYVGGMRSTSSMSRTRSSVDDTSNDAGPVDQTPTLSPRETRPALEFGGSSESSSPRVANSIGDMAGSRSDAMGTDSEAGGRLTPLVAGQTAMIDPPSVGGAVDELSVGGRQVEDEPESEPESEPEPEPDPQPEPEPEFEPEPNQQFGFNLCGIGASEMRVGGSWDQPILVPYLPMLDRADTTIHGESRIDTYDCARDTGENGPEIVYRFTTRHDGDFRAEVLDSNGVDVDLHLLRNPQRDGRRMNGCLGRAHRQLVIDDLPAGEYVLVVDSWSNASGEIFGGEFTVAFDVIEKNVWTDIPLKDGVVWSRWRGQRDGRMQTMNRVRIPPRRLPQLHLRSHDGCMTVADYGSRNGAILGLNGGYFGPGCRHVGLIQIGGDVMSQSAPTTPALPQQATVAWNDANIASDWRPTGQGWLAYRDAVSAHPMLVRNGVAEAEVEPGQRVHSAVDWGHHPRSAMGIDRDGQINLFTVDGRTNAGAGLTTPALANWLDELDIIDAINLDGGGSTTLYVQDCWINNVVNFPSDNRAPDHDGARSVSSGIYLYP